MPATGDERWMRRALELAARGAGETNPNPMVGCVVVRGGRLVGQGHHARAGAPHAEVVALEQAGARARGATLYANLEPCSHQGRTPPCAPRILEAGIRRVVAAVRDPNPRVDGRGLRLLRDSGLDVSTGVLAAEARALNERFLVSARLQRPFVLLKAALTLDGRIAAASGDSKWITEPRQRRAARGLRRLHDGVLVGIGTALADDPRLMPQPVTRRPFLRIVLDSRLRLPLDSQLVRSARRSPVWAVCGRPETRRRRALADSGVKVLSGPSRGGKVSLEWLLARLWQEGVTSLMVEGGSAVLGEFLAARLVDQVALFRAPILLGGRDSLPAFGGPNPLRVSEALKLRPGNPVLPGLSPALGTQTGPGQVGLCEVWYPEGRPARLGEPPSRLTRATSRGE